MFLRARIHSSISYALEFWQASSTVMAAAELKRCVQELGFVGALISGRPLTGSVFLDGSRFDTLWKVF